MNANHTPWEPPDLRFYAENRRNFPVDQLTAHAGKFVAWNPEGTRILASGHSREEVWRQLETAGIDVSQVVNDYIDPLDEAPIA